MEAALAGGGAAAYADSVDSSPRSRSETWDEPYLSSSAPAKLRLMCSYGGHIVPRPHDKTLCYLGGETRIVVVDRNTTLSDLTSKLSRSLLSGRPFSLKYQLPSEDLDSLISVTTDEDLDNMIEEYDRIAAATGGGVKPSRIRLFLFSVKPDSTSSSISSLLDDSKSETWFVDALNGVVGGNGGILPRGLSADSTGSSVNCLLGLEDDAGAAPPPPPAAPVEQERPTSPEKAAAGKSGLQDVQSVPDSPMLDTTSSFGSASSAPILSNLPPIRVRADDRGPPEEHFAQMNLLAQRQEEGANGGGFPLLQRIQSPPAPAVAAVNTGAGVVAPVGVATTPVISPTEDPTRVSRAFSSDEEKVEQGSVRKQQQQQPPQADVVPPQNPSVFEVPIPQRIYYPDRSTAGVAGLSSGSDGKQEAAQNVVPESNYRVHLQPQEPSYLIPIQPEKFQQPQQQQQQPHQPQQYVHANPQLMQHQSPTPVVPYQSFYQMQPQMHSQQQMPQAHPYNQQIPMFFMPIQNPNYGLPIQQHNLADTVGMTPQGKPTLPMPNSVLQTQGVVNSAAKPEMVPAANLYRTNAPALGAVAQSTHSPQLIHLADQTHQQFVGYHPMQHHPSQSVAAAGYRYEYGNPVHMPQLYYTQPTSSPLPSHFQTVSSGVATVISDAPSQLLQADVKQTRASS